MRLNMAIARGMMASSYNILAQPRLWAYCRCRWVASSSPGPTGPGVGAEMLPLLPLGLQTLDMEATLCYCFINS